MSNRDPFVGKLIIRKHGSHLPKVIFPPSGYPEGFYGAYHSLPAPIGLMIYKKKPKIRKKRVAKTNS